MSPRLTLKSLRSAAIRAYVWKPLKAGFPSTPGVASASPEYAKRTGTSALGAGAVSKRPTGLVASACWNRYVQRAPAGSPRTGIVIVRSSAARARPLPRSRVVRPRAVHDPETSMPPARGARVHRRAELERISPAATPWAKTASAPPAPAASTPARRATDATTDAASRSTRGVYAHGKAAPACCQGASPRCAVVTRFAPRSRPGGRLGAPRHSVKPPRGGTLPFAPRGCSSMVELQPSKLAMRVRFPPPALLFAAGYSANPQPSGSAARSAGPPRRTRADP